MNTQENGTKKYSHLAAEFSTYILGILIVAFVGLNLIIVHNVKAFSKEDYSSFSEKVIAEDAGKIQYWNEVLVKLPVGAFSTPETRLVKWMFTCAFTTPDGRAAADLRYEDFQNEGVSSRNVAVRPLPEGPLPLMVPRVAQVREEIVFVLNN